jgi:5-methylcytosine-specific restriction endonuclease McrA
MREVDMAERTCAHCGKPLPPDAHHRRKFCDRSCERANYKVPTACSWCGETFLRDRYTQTKWGRPYCSLDCRRNFRDIDRAVPVTYTDCAGCGRTFTHDARHPRSRCTASCQPAKPTPARFHTGPCPRCGTTVTTDRLAGYNAANRYCSARCAVKDAKARRRARKRGAHTEPVYRRRIFERDSWRCQICRRKVDPTKEVPHPRAPTIDHVVPLAAGGTHEPANVQTACFLCNATKGDRGTDQLRLIG